MQENLEYIEAKQKFDEYYHNTIIPSVQPLEKRRKKFLSYFILICLVVICWVGLLITGKIPLKGNNYGFILCMAVLGICAPMLFYYKQTKESILPILVNFFGDFLYIYQPELSEALLKKSLVMKQYDSLSTDDGFEGTYNNIPVVITEYTRFRHREQKKDGISRIIKQKKGHGIIFRAKMNKDFEGQTIIVRDKGFMNKFSHYKGMQRVGIEYPEFEKAYEVYSDNQIEARYILTTVMIEYIMQLKNVFKAVEYSFFDNQVLINIEMKENFFECSSFFRTIINKKRLYKNFNQFHLLFSIIHILHLHQNKLL